ncbi:hypothetical protein [Pseudomonas alliivorans]|uniref:hypothetical protein n=1 Tax=Pseudomonas alliivorans TaxID=2810613 RepID=UPI00403B2FAD
MIGFVLSVFFNTLALVLASRIMDVGLRIFPAFLVVGLSQMAGELLQGSDKTVHTSEIVISAVICFVGLRFFTGESSWTVFKLMIISILIFVVIALALARLF